MVRQRRSETRPELAVRRAVHALGHRFRLDNRDLPGSPDVANRARKWAIFVHGCFWHAHEGCPRHTVPRRNRKWWVTKFADNRARDARVAAALRERGFTVVVVWECEVEREQQLERRLRKALPAG
jgi:DNA mismatch endonuclease (patch repair protein)